MVFMGGFQYTSSGNVPGILGAVDLDKFTEDILLSDSSTQVHGADVTPDNNITRYVVKKVTRCGDFREFGGYS